MNLFVQEIKKLMNPMVLCAITVLGSLYFYLFPSFQIDYFSNGRNQEALFDLSAGWAERYGTTLEGAEWDGIKNQLTEEKAAFPDRLEAWRENRIATYQEMKDEYQERGDTEVVKGIQEDISALQRVPSMDYDTFRSELDAYNQVMRSAGYQTAAAQFPLSQFYQYIQDSTNFYTIQELEHFLERQAQLEEQPYSQTEAFAVSPPAVQARVLELEARDQGYIPLSVLDSTMLYSCRLGVWVVLSVVLLLSPSLVRDRLYRMRSAQWASRQGRGILRVQMAAALAAAAGLTMVNIVLYAIPYLIEHPLIFQKFSLYNPFHGRIPWFDWTFLQYLLVLAGMELALGLAAGALTVFLSQYSGNYVAMLLKAVPLFLAVGLLFSTGMLSNAFFERQTGLGYLPRGIEFVMIAGMLALGGGSCLWALRRQRGRELLGE